MFGLESVRSVDLGFRKYQKAARRAALTAALLLSGAAAALAGSAAAQTGQSWERIATPSDVQRLETGPNRLAEDVGVAAQQGKVDGITLPAVMELMRAIAQPLAERDLMGDWRCRSIQIDKFGIFGYPPFRCRVRQAGDGLFFEKLTGSQRVSGFLYARDGVSFVLLGGATVNEEPQRRYTSDSRAPAEVLQHNRAGLVTKIGPGRLRVVFPQERGQFEVLDLTR